MKNVNFKFTVSTNANIYFATTLNAIVRFCKKHDFVVTKFAAMDYYSYLSFTYDKKHIIKCGRGIYGIIDNANKS